jgi:hypothetical protein
MPSAPILCLGAHWKASDVYWKTAPENGALYGVDAANLTGHWVNFVQQTGIYILYGDYRPVYVGQANGTLFARLQMHYRKDDLVGRWNTFTWFGMRRALAGEDPALSSNESNFSISRGQLLDHFEAAMIHAFEPPLNGQEGRFGEVVVRYSQKRDKRLGPSDRDLLEEIAKTVDALPEGMKITPSGWKSTE